MYKDCKEGNNFGIFFFFFPRNRREAIEAEVRLA